MFYADAQDRKDKLIFDDDKYSFLEFSMGLSYAHFTDFAISPLRYQGTPFYLSVGHQTRGTQRESLTNFSYVFGRFTNETGTENSESNFKSISLSLKELYRLNFLSSENRSIKAGGHFNTTANFRENKQLFNSSEGVEIIGNLFGTMSSSFYFNTASKNSKELFFNVDVGIVNANYRNPFAYVNDSPVLNDANFFEDYTLNIFFRIQVSHESWIFMAFENQQRHKSFLHLGCLQHR